MKAYIKLMRSTILYINFQFNYTTKPNMIKQTFTIMSGLMEKTLYSHDNVYSIFCIIIIVWNFNSVEIPLCFVRWCEVDFSSKLNIQG